MNFDRLVLVIFLVLIYTSTNVLTNSENDYLNLTKVFSTLVGRC